MLDLALPLSSRGIYINQMIGDEGEGQVSTGYGANYSRLVAIKSKYDPDTLFRHNQNIQPPVGELGSMAGGGAPLIKGLKRALKRFPCLLYPPLPF